MPPKIKSCLTGEAMRLKPLRPRKAADFAAARRPILPTHTAGTTNHAQHHAPLKSQS